MIILFVIPQLDYADHVAVAYLSAIAKQIGHQTFFCNLDKDDFFSILDKVGPDVVAYSVNILGYRDVVQAHRTAKEKHSFVSIMGGPHPTYSPETFLESGMDVYCVGEGEYAFRDFLLRLEKGLAYDDIANLITRKQANPVRPLVKDLDELPSPDRDLVISNSFLKDTSKKTFYATRGCPFHCAYCCNNYFHKLYEGKGPVVRRFSVERVLREIEDVKSKYRMDFIKFGDDLFAFKADAWLEEFADKYPARIGVPFNCYLRLDRVDDDLLKLLKKSGVYSVHLSLDSTSEVVRETVLERNMLKIDIVGNLRKIRSYGIATWVNYMLAAPGSTLQDDLDTIRLSRQADVTYASYSTTVPMKGTRLYDYCVANGMLDPRTHVGDMTGCSQRSTLSCFTEKEKDIRFNIYILGAILAKFPNGFFQAGLWIIKIIPPNRFFRFIRNLYYAYNIENKIFLLRKG